MLESTQSYDGTITITASGRLLDRINRLRRDCIKALGFNLLAQVGVSFWNFFILRMSPNLTERPLPFNA
jgi:hypothetical protein